MRVLQHVSAQWRESKVPTVLAEVDTVRWRRCRVTWVRVQDGRRADGGHYRQRADRSSELVFERSGATGSRR